MELEDFLQQYGYFALSVATFFEGEIAILLASSLIFRGLFDGPQTVFFAFLGSFISDWLYYLIGRLNGKVFVERRAPLQKRMRPLLTFFEKNKIQILFSYRFLYGFRVVIPLLIGMSGINPRQYLFYSIVAGMIWASTVSTLGYVIGKVFNLSIETFQENFVMVMLGFAAFGLLLGFTVKRFADRRILSTEE